MRKIGFKNFKCFKNIEPIELSPITILVGGNNAGKSSFLKGTLLVSENIGHINKTDFYCPIFSFDLNKFHAGISTFDRNQSAGITDDIEFVAHYTFVDYNEDVISTYNQTRFIVKLSVSAYNKETANDVAIGRITRIEIEDRANLMLFVLDFKTKRMSIVIKKPSDGNEEVLFSKLLEREKNKSKRAIQFGVSGVRENLCDSEENRDNLFSVEMPLEQTYDSILLNTKSTLGAYIENFICFFDSFRKGSYYERNDMDRVAEQCVTVNYTKMSDDDAFEKVFRPCLLLIKNSALSLERAIYTPKEHVINIRTYDINRSVLYNSKDRNDFMAESIVRYLSCKDTAADRYILYWMKEFEIGHNFKINSIAGEYYSIDVEVEPDLWRPLCDLGTGVNKIMILLMNLAAIRKFNTYEVNNSIIVIEEPEQNLHPKFQSKLADLFASLETDDGTRPYLIVETHSEYLVRRSQVLVAKKKYSTNDECYRNTPFKTYYFPKDDIPYSMEYRKDGKFVNDFRPGFFDEASDLLLQIL